MTAYQDRVSEWVAACFPAEARTDLDERAHRFMEEALELVQANGCTKHDVLRLVDYVFDRPDGPLQQEVGGVMVTLAAFCSAAQISLDEAAENELQRNWRRIEAIRAKHAGRPSDSPLPQILSDAPISAMG